VAEESDLLLAKRTFREFNLPVITTQQLEYAAEMLQVVR
jgi:hypothetical protein